ncbi:MAG: hypothetical protein HYU41_15845 [Candidatus Rokubacteria bacterium]|nr:hypothetical protein [Candidatus Rokubacteria bacterium]
MLPLLLAAAAVAAADPLRVTRVFKLADVAGAVVNGRLHAIVYDSTALHHFGRYRPEAERVIESVRFK